jgi:hypothetical protein
MNKQELFSVTQITLNLLTHEIFSKRQFIRQKNTKCIKKRQIYLIIIPTCTCCFKQRTLLYQTVNGDNYNDITTVSKTLQLQQKFDIGDEIQLFYRRKMV